MRKGVEVTSTRHRQWTAWRQTSYRKQVRQPQGREERLDVGDRREAPGIGNRVVHGRDHDELLIPQIVADRDFCGALLQECRRASRGEVQAVFRIPVSYTHLTL